MSFYCRTLLATSLWPRHVSITTLVHRPGRHTWIELDFPEGAFVAGNILLQQPQQRLRLLRAQINPLEIADLDLRFTLLLQRAENEEKVPDVHPHRHAVRIILSVRRIT